MITIDNEIRQILSGTTKNQEESFKNSKEITGKEEIKVARIAELLKKLAGFLDTPLKIIAASQIDYLMEQESLNKDQKEKLWNILLEKES